MIQRLLGALPGEHVGAAPTRAMQVEGDALVIRPDATSGDGAEVTRTLTWERVG